MTLRERGHHLVDQISEEDLPVVERMLRGLVREEPASPAAALAEATVQEIQLELIRRTDLEAFRGERVVAALTAHRDLWEAVLFDSLGVARPGSLPAAGLIKLRDLSQNFWNVDTLYILCPDAGCAHRLAAAVESEDWGGMTNVHDDEEEVESTLGGSGRGQAIVTIWWD